MGPAVGQPGAQLHVQRLCPSGQRTLRPPRGRAALESTASPRHPASTQSPVVGGGGSSDSAKGRVSGLPAARPCPAQDAVWRPPMAALRAACRGVPRRFRHAPTHPAGWQGWSGLSQGTGAVGHRLGGASSFPLYLCCLNTGGCSQHHRGPGLGSRAWGPETELTARYARPLVVVEVLILGAVVAAWAGGHVRGGRLQCLELDAPLPRATVPSLCTAIPGLSPDLQTAAPPPGPRPQLPCTVAHQSSCPPSQSLAPGRPMLHLVPLTLSPSAPTGPGEPAVLWADRARPVAVPSMLVPGKLCSFWGQRHGW